MFILFQREVYNSKGGKFITGIITGQSSSGQVGTFQDEFAEQREKDKGEHTKYKVHTMVQQQYITCKRFEFHKKII